MQAMTYWVMEVIPISLLLVNETLHVYKRVLWQLIIVMY